MPFVKRSSPPGLDPRVAAVIDAVIEDRHRIVYEPRVTGTYGSVGPWSKVVHRDFVDVTQFGDATKTYIVTYSYDET